MMATEWILLLLHQHFYYYFRFLHNQPIFLQSLQVNKVLNKLIPFLTKVSHHHHNHLFAQSITVTMSNAAKDSRAGQWGNIELL